VRVQAGEGTATSATAGAWTAFILACVTVAAAVAWQSPWNADPASAEPGTVAAKAVPSADPGPVRPVDNDCSGGYVYLTFDDGPAGNTPALLDRLRELNLRATFFVIGSRVAGREDVVRRELAEGHSVQNHTFHHHNLVTGVDVGGVQRAPWGEAQIAAELVRANEALVAAGAPQPTLYRPPYGEVDARVDSVARRYGLRLVMPWSSDPRDSMIDSHDTVAGQTMGDIVRSVTRAIRADSIITMHDGQGEATLNSTAALQRIVDVMNEKRLCSSVEMRPDADGDVLDTTDRASR
jgi:peptidoglycan/xylan/chitin deacetylase (PgdA/CDA1 family)